MRRALFSSGLFLLLACGGAPGAPIKQPDGGYALYCRGPLSDCLRHAERLCKDDGYWVAEARDSKQLLGHESGQSRILIEKSDATIYCGTRSGSAPIRLVRAPDPAPTASASAAPTADATPPAKPAPSCVPGASQACVGPAGCTGGQTCAADGAHFEPCDCGPPKGAAP